MSQPTITESNWSVGRLLIKYILLQNGLECKSGCHLHSYMVVGLIYVSLCNIKLNVFCHPTEVPNVSIPMKM